MKSRVLLVLVLDIYDVMMTQNTISAPIEQEAPATHSNQQRSLGLAVRSSLYTRSLDDDDVNSQQPKNKDQTPDPLFRNNSQKKKKKKTNRREQKTKNAI